MNIEFGKEHVDIECNGRKARFSGDMGVHYFRAVASSMKWILPRSDRQISISQAERKEWIDAINSHFENIKYRVFFVDDKGNELKFD